MKVQTVAKHKLTEVINTDPGERLTSFVRACLDGKKDDLYRGNQTDVAHLQNELESIVNEIGELCYDKGYQKGIAEKKQN